MANTADKRVGVEIISVPEHLAGGREKIEHLLDAAVRHINATYTRKGMEVVLEVGKYVLDTFFDGDSASFREHAGSHVTFRQLAERDDLQMSHVWIWRAVGVVDQLHVLPEAAATQLPYTHHTLLLPLKSEKKKRTLAERAIEDGWSKRKLEDEVKKARKKERGAKKVGRPALPAFVRTLNKLAKLSVDDADLWGGQDDIDTLAPEEAERLWKAAAGMKLRCEELQKKLQPKVPGFTERG